MKFSTLRFSTAVLAGAGLALQLASCVSTEREISSSDPRTTYRPPAAGDRARLNSKTVLNTVSASHVFSNPNTRDNFILQLRGPRVLTAQAHLIVTSSTGDTLTHQVLPARALLAEQVQTDPQGLSIRDQEIAVLQRMNAFFAESHFSQPAVPPGTEAPAEVDTKAWSALREDPSTVAFDYPGMGGAEHRLAYARKLGKAVIISR